MVIENAENSEKTDVENQHWQHWNKAAGIKTAARVKQTVANVRLTKINGGTNRVSRDEKI